MIMRRTNLYIHLDEDLFSVTARPSPRSRPPVDPPHQLTDNQQRLWDLAIAGTGTSAFEGWALHAIQTHILRSFPDGDVQFIDPLTMKVSTKIQQ